MYRRMLLMLAAATLAVGITAPVSAAPPRTTSLVFGECWAGMYDDAYRNTGILGQIEHASGVIVWDLWVYDGDAGTWSWAGTDVNPSWDVYNDRTGYEVFGGKFNLTSSAIGDFTGSFIWHENPSGVGGHSEGRSTDGAGVLWKGTLGSIDPAPYLPLPQCMVEQEVSSLSEVVLTAH